MAARVAVFRFVPRIRGNPPRQGTARYPRRAADYHAAAAHSGRTLCLRISGRQLRLRRPYGSGGRALACGTQPDPSRRLTAYRPIRQPARRERPITLPGARASESHHSPAAPACRVATPQTCRTAQNDLARRVGARIGEGFRAGVSGRCQFPKQWAGRWFQSGVPHLITLNATHIETKGECVESDGDKFLTEDKGDNCYRCVVIHEKHQNVLQYKETFCDSRASLSSLCDTITGDATLYSMFRAEPHVQPTACPFRGPPFTFTYNRGAGECRSPVSRLDSCSDEARLLMRYQACPDVTGTESTVEELVCLATWKEGSTRYLVGKLYHKTATTDEDRYRCFVYDRSQRDGHVTYNVAQSGDATCSGLLSATEGSRTMSLTKVENRHTQCRFPSWVTDHHNWYTLDMKQSYHFSHKNATLRITDDSAHEVRIVCHSVEKSPPGVDAGQQATLVAHITSGCNSGYVCMVFYRRDGHVIELQQTTHLVQAPEEACNPAYLKSALPHTTLITVSLRPRKCPFDGRYNIIGGGTSTKSDSDTAQHGLLRSRRQEGSAGAVGGNSADPGTGMGTGASDCTDHNLASLDIGCSSGDTMRFYPACGEHPEHSLEYLCHGSWEDNGTNYLIVSPKSRKSGGAHHYCFIYTKAGGAGTPSDFTSSGTTGSDFTGKRRRGGGVSSSTSASEMRLMLSSVTDYCRRNVVPGVTGESFYNLTMTGHCTSAPTGGAQTTSAVLFSVLILAGLVLLVSNLR
ncbi:uncharacterized protein LOC124545759 [Schistocerca americana]|uniref:uncharacterized protein LOC124545759 n=1 Tax=Schistocerca americana TaxID=7009 RepID=UPI001F4F3333|nr:uncharacterized protein LOC124545759 [Schistocerca americana]